MEKVSGFSIIRHGVRFDYPFLESWRSLLPLVDELVINVGIGEDETLNVAKEFAEKEGQGKVVLFESHWPLDDPEQRRSGKILADQTNLALDRCTNDLCFYLQSDEVLHEEDTLKIKKSFQSMRENPSIDAIVFSYLHFYGSYDVIQDTRSAYRREMRIIRKSSLARSVGDAQSFLKPQHQKLNALLTSARIFHYGWVRTPEAMKEKTQFMDGLYHGQSSDAITGNAYQYKKFWGLKPFQGTHPAVMKDRIQQKGWSWDLSRSPWVFHISDVKKVLLDCYENVTGHRPFEFKNYEIKGRMDHPQK